MEKFKVVFLSGSLSLSGSTVWVNNLIEATQDLGVSCAHVVIGDKNKVKSSAYNVYKTCKARRLFFINLLRVFQIYKLFPKFYGRVEDSYYCRKMECFLGGRVQDKVLVIKDNSAILPSFFLSDQFNIVSVLHHQNQVFQPLACDVLVAVSHAIMEGSRNIGFNVQHVVYNPVSTGKIIRLSEEYQPEEQNYIVYVGRLIREKGVFELFTAFANLYKSGLTSHKLLYIGSGRCDPELKKRIKEEGLEGIVVLKGFSENPYPYIKHAKLLVLPSYSEAMGYVAVEASILGTSYLVADYPAAQEFFCPENIFSMGTTSDEFVNNLKNKIVSLLDSPQAQMKSGVLQEMEPTVVAKKFLGMAQ